MNILRVLSGYTMPNRTKNPDYKSEFFSEMSYAKNRMSRLFDILAVVNFLPV